MGEENRKGGSRIPAKDLPELLRKFKIDLGTGELLEANTIDANKSGISLIVPIQISKVTNYDVKLYSFDKSIIIEDEIVYIKSLTPQESRISIMFTNLSGLKEYNRLLDSISS